MARSYWSEGRTVHVVDDSRPVPRTLCGEAVSASLIYQPTGAAPAVTCRLCAAEAARP